MLEIALAIVSLAIAYLITKTESLAWKTFFTLLFFLNLFLIPAITFDKTEEQYCVNFDPQSQFCKEWHITYDVAGKEAIVYGFGLLFIVVLFIVILQIVVKSFEAAI